MPRTTTYLELSQDGAGAHKFYEVTVEGAVVSVRYGRIGADGQSQTSSFPSEAKAQAAQPGRSARRSARATRPRSEGSARQGR